MPCPLSVSFAWTLARALYLFAPLLVSAAFSAVVHRYDLFPRLARPIDAARFGEGKTWRGVAIAVVGSIATAFVQKHMLRAGTLAVVDYQAIDPVLFGAALGGSAMLGELPNSFVKRRLGIPRGGTAKTPGLRVLFWTWDQVDLLTTAWPCLAFWVRPSASLVFASFVLGLVVHPLIALIGYLVGARRTAR